MNKKIIGIGIVVLVLGVIFYLVGSYYSSSSYFMSTPMSQLSNAYRIHDMGNMLETFGLLFSSVGISVSVIGMVLKPERQKNNINQGDENE